MKEDYQYYRMLIETLTTGTYGSTGSPRQPYHPPSQLTSDERRRREREDGYINSMKRAYKPDLPIQLFLEEEARKKASKIYFCVGLHVCL